ncbi:MAG: FMN-binding glutamate synthase family protein [Myxococcota bacterium]|nr:FMN-binding glutamate synthase family protein [Myxococcota bacterium]
MIGGFGGLLLLLGGLALYDICQNRSAIRHNFPVIGWGRYLLEQIGPELRQYLVANDKEERPFNRDERRWIYATAKGENNNFGFGTTEIIYGIGYPIIKHAAFPVNPGHAMEDPTAIPCAKVMGQSHGRKRAFRPSSVVNISAMSFGSLGERAITSLNQGAKLANCFHNSGEGSVSPYHLRGADVMWQLGTAYFGARNDDGSFSLEKAQKKVSDHASIRCIEIKLSQGAKPGKGGILPGSKVTAEIAATRGIPEGLDCLSPNSHGEFSCANTLIDFVESIAEGTGLPVGIKSAVGEIRFWEDLAAAMKVRNAGPDFITIDGGEGGTGAAPLTFTDHVALPFKVGFQRVYRTFQAQGVAQDIVWIGSGKLGLPDRAVVAMAMGCDLINIAREAMMAIGCIQAQHCHTDFCPTGIATHNPWLQGGLNVADKTERFARFVRGFRKELLALSHTAGYEHPCQFTGQDVEFSTGVNKFSSLSEVLG